MKRKRFLFEMKKKKSFIFCFYPLRTWDLLFNAYLVKNCRYDILHLSILSFKHSIEGSLGSCATLLVCNTPDNCSREWAAEMRHPSPQPDCCRTTTLSARRLNLNKVRRGGTLIERNHGCWSQKKLLKDQSRKQIFFLTYLKKRWKTSKQWRRQIVESFHNT